MISANGIFYLKLIKYLTQLQIYMGIRDPGFNKPVIFDFLPLFNEDNVYGFFWYLIINK